MRPFEKIRANFDTEVTPLVGYGACCLLAIFAFLMLESYNEFAQAKQAELHRFQQDVSALRSLESQDDWQNRLERSQEVKQQFEDALWQGSTPGVIAADFQQEVQLISGRHNGTQLNLSVDPQPETVENIDILRFSVTARFETGREVIAWYSELASYTPIIIFEEFSTTTPTRRGQQSYVSGTGFIPVNVVAETAGAVE